jgi:tight adherence protein B
MNPTLLTILGFAAADMAVLGVYSLVSEVFLRDRSRVSRRVDEEFRNRQRERAQRSLLKNLAEQGADELMLKDSWRDSLELLIERSGINITPRRLLTFMAATGAVFAIIIVALGLNPWAAIPAAVGGAFLPLGYVLIKRNARMFRLLTQLPDAFDLMSRCIRAGQTMSQIVAGSHRRV